MIKRFTINDETDDMIYRCFKYESISDEIFKTGCKWCKDRGADFFSFTPTFWEWFKMEFYDIHLEIYNQNEFKPKPLEYWQNVLKGYFDEGIKTPEPIRIRMFIEYEEHKINPKKRLKVQKQPKVTKEIKSLLKKNLNTI